MKKLIIISSDEYIRNYVSNGTLKPITDRNTVFAVLDTVAVPDAMKSAQPLEFLSVSPDEVKRFNFYSLLLMRRHRAKSTSFHFRFKRMFPAVYFFHYHLIPGRVRNSEGYSIAAEKVSWLPEMLFFPVFFLLNLLQKTGRFLKSFPKWLFIVSVNFLHLSDGLVEHLRKSHPPNASLSSLLDRLQPDLIIIPASAFEAIGDQVIMAAKKRGLKTLFLIDNWDNLSSKSIFPETPDFLVVWGEQSARQAEEIHGMATDRVFAIGTPRYEVYYRFRGGRKSSPVKYPYVLFAGCAVAFDEIGALRRLNEIIERNQSRLPVGLKVLYRPHPWGRRPHYIRTLEKIRLPHVEVDPQILESVRRDISAEKFQPDLNYYPGLLHNAHFIVCPLSTMIIESTIMGRKNLVLTYDDGQSATSPDKMYANYRHFEKLEDLGNCLFVHRLEDLEENFLEIATMKTVIHPRALAYYLQPGGLQYPLKLKKVIDSLRGVKPPRKRVSA